MGASQELQKKLLAQKCNNAAATAACVTDVTIANQRAALAEAEVRRIKKEHADLQVSYNGCTSDARSSTVPRSCMFLASCGQIVLSSSAALCTQLTWVVSSQAQFKEVRAQIYPRGPRDSGEGYTVEEAGAPSADGILHPIPIPIPLPPSSSKRKRDKDLNQTTPPNACPSGKI